MNEFSETPTIIDSADKARSHLVNIGRLLDELHRNNYRISGDEYATLVQLEMQWCFTCQKIVGASYETWKKIQEDDE